MSRPPQNLPSPTMLEEKFNFPRELQTIKSTNTAEIAYATKIVCFAQIKDLVLRMYIV